MCLGFVQNFAGFVAVRALLGIAEGGLLPGMVCFQRSTELALAIVNKAKRSCICLLSIDEAIWLCGLVCSTQLLPCRAHLEVHTHRFHLFSLADANKLGLLARGLAEIGPRGGIEGWRWILIIEGLLVCEGDFY